PFSMGEVSMTASPASLSDTVVLLHFPTIGLSQRLNVSNYTFLGRPNNQETRPMVDLTIFLGHLLGVSREHAALILTDEGLHIQDLGSTNGSWLNQRRLAPRSPVPLQNGDH